MPELVTPDGQPVDPAAEAVNTEFARAMAADPAEPAAPPKRPEPPPAEPKRPRGRPRKEDQARVTAKAAPAAALTDKDRADGVRGLVQISAGLCLIASRATAKPDKDGVKVDNQAFKADAITLASSADDLAQACADTARADARFAAVLDRVCAVGPYGALLTAVLGVGTQIARNHRPGMAIPGTTHPADLIAGAEQPAAAA